MTERTPFSTKSSLGNGGSSENGQKNVIIVGGGLAGLAAAQAISSQGIKVDLHESRPRLGGRASSFVDRTTGELIDNCQHVAMGCCTNFFRFCQQAGIDSFFTELPELLFHDEHGRTSKLANNSLPAPLHLVSSFLKMQHFSWRERFHILQGLSKLARTPNSTLNFAEWLTQQNQPLPLQQNFWNVILVSALSETLDRISFKAARQVFLEGFMVHREAWKVWLPTCPLHELYGEQLQNHLQQRGVTIHLQDGLSEVEITKTKPKQKSVSQLRFQSGSAKKADAYLLALPWHLVPRVFSSDSGSFNFVKQAGQLESAPISSVHLWFDQPLTEQTHAVLLGKMSQWVFNRSAIQNTNSSSHYAYQVVISQSRKLTSLSQTEIISQVMDELQEIWPTTFSQANLVHSRVVTEHKAVFSVTPESENLRPSQKTELDNLYLAGDWAQTDWPATMEGAVRSGYLAAEKLLRDWGIHARINQPDLPRSRLARWFWPR